VLEVRRQDRVRQVALERLADNEVNAFSAAKSIVERGACRGFLTRDGDVGQAGGQDGQDGHSIRFHQSLLPIKMHVFHAFSHHSIAVARNFAEARNDR
jgi:hypothetical protein